jgi:hypothetical protein
MFYLFLKIGVDKVFNRKALMRFGDASASINKSVFSIDFHSRSEQSLIDLMKPISIFVEASARYIILFRRVRRKQFIFFKKKARLEAANNLKPHIFSIAAVKI